MLTLRRITCSVFIINLILTLYTAYVFFFAKLNDSNYYSLSAESENNQNGLDEWFDWDSELKFDKNYTKKLRKTYNNASDVNIEIWAKAAIGFYLWEHILKGQIDKKLNSGVYYYGYKKFDNYKFKFRGGPLVSFNSLKQVTISNLILVLNGRDKEKISFSMSWLNTIRYDNINIKNIGVILLGDEHCSNKWIEPYLENHGGPIKFLFLVYDSPNIDNKTIYQWPLGIATYRDFPNPDYMKLNLHLPRPYICNFIATIYQGSSREELVKLINNNNLFKKLCFVKARYEWQPKETKDSLDIYVEALRLSDLTLSPIGMNHECYRIFEAVSFGSLPVLEENLNFISKTNCDKKSPYRLFKQYNAPFIYISNWTQDLPHIIESELKLTLEDKIHRRIELIKWYHKFKINLRNKLFDVINEKFFDNHN